MAKSVNKSKRNLNGNGSVDYQKALNLWRGRRWLQGKRHVIYSKTQAGANHKLKNLPETLEAKALEEARKAESDKRTTVADYLNHWLATEVKLKSRANTYDNYERMVRVHLIPKLGRFFLNELTSDDISDKWIEMIEEGCSPSLIEHCHARLTTAYNVAIDKGTYGVIINPTLKATRPSVEKEEVNPLSTEDYELLLDTVRDTDYFSIIHTALHTGMRRNELLALRWNDIDLAMGAISVHRQVYRSKGVTAYHPLKTKNARRFISLPPEALQHLTKEWERQIDKGKLHGYKIIGNSPVFRRSTGEEILPNGLTHAFKQIVNRIAEERATELGVSLEDISLSKNHFHDLRHTHASILYAQNTPDVVISKRLGHATVAITMEIYVHIRPTMEKDYIQNFSLHPTKTWV
jgi:integrase